jgi:hypothetical protein
MERFATRELLEPTLDVVFKLLLTRNPELLREMIESVLGCEPVSEVMVLNPRAIASSVRANLVKSATETDGPKRHADDDS